MVNLGNDWDDLLKDEFKKDYYLQLREFLKEDKYDNIIKHFYFKDPSLYARNSQYAMFMKQVTTYTRSGKVPHDDAPDSLSLLENELRGLVGAKVEVFKRPC